MVPVVINRKAIKERDQRLKEYSLQPNNNIELSKNEQLIIASVIGTFILFCFIMSILYLKMSEEKTLKSKVYYYGSFALYIIATATLFLIKIYSNNGQ